MDVGVPMRKAVSFLAVALLSAGAFVTDARAEIIVDVRPPPPRVLVLPAERPGYVWAPGYWRWSGHRHDWVDGHWMRARHGWHWVPSHWEGRHGRFHFVEGHWAR